MSARAVQIVAGLALLLAIVLAALLVIAVIIVGYLVSRPDGKPSTERKQ